MYFLNYYYKKVIKYDLVNKFPKNNNILKNIPKLKKIILSFKSSNAEPKKIISMFILLELLTFKKAKITKNSKPNIMLKIKKGTPAGCKVTLTNKLMFDFLFKLLSEIFPNMNEFKQFSLKKNKHQKSLSFKIKEIILLLPELEEHYNLLNGSVIPDLHVTLVTNTSNSNELLFLLKSLKVSAKSI